MTRPLLVENLSVAFGGVHALDNASLHVDEGRCVALIGPNGAGKTTLFDAVTGIAFPQQGHIELFGHDVGGWPLHRRVRLGVGRTFQRLELFGSLTVEDNVLAALEAQSDGGGLAAELLELTGLRELAGTRAGELPMGHARTLELARTLATGPKLLLLDEPSSGLNDEETAALAVLLKRLQSEHELSLLIVEHDMNFVLPLSDEVYVLDFGQVVAHGTPDEVRKDAVVQAVYLGEEIGTP